MKEFLEQWEIDVRKQLEDKLVKKEELKKESIIYKPKKKSNNSLVYLVLFLFLMLGLSYYHKKPKISLPKNEEITLLQRIDKLNLENNNKLEKILSKLDLQSKRIVLLGALHNENFLIIKNGANKNHLIFFNEDWTLNQSPKYLKMTPEEIEFFEKWTQK